MGGWRVGVRVQVAFPGILKLVCPEGRSVAPCAPRAQVEDILRTSLGHFPTRGGRRQHVLVLIDRHQSFEELDLKERRIEVIGLARIKTERLTRRHA